MAAELTFEEEKERVIDLFQYDIFNHHKDVLLDQITKVAANICEVPISLINLISEDTLLAKSSYGMDINEEFNNTCFSVFLFFCL